ncbi:unnamed protein product [Miscanthus lutarioriparius]|uniref:Transporter-associated domain-containing protein n=1 Tax=Miscanthus lutarioriparius TaxID=422564 RepID=A0A811RA05_9POAL|nr:unnamed protein product [Miscanthus lutarioriparius]
MAPSLPFFFLVAPSLRFFFPGGRILHSNEALNQFPVVYNKPKEEIQKKTGYIVRRGDGTFDVDANTSIDHLSEELGIKIPEGHQYETVSGFVCASFGYIPEEGGKMLVILEKDYREENGEYQEEGSDRQDDREKTQAYELELKDTTKSFNFLC